MKIVISGTYSTGKTTLSLALSYLTGIPKTQAKTMRELLPVTFPGYALTQCAPAQLIELGIRRFTERIEAEIKMNGNFISDGCPIQEWIYGNTRLSTGLNPSENIEIVRKWIAANMEEWNVFKQAIDGFGKVVKKYTSTQYDTIIHLPIEFPFVADGHRPTSEFFREESEKTLIETYKEMGISPFIATGSLKERLLRITSHLGLPNLISVEKAMQMAEDQKRQRIDAIKIERREVDVKDLFDNI